MIGIRSVSPFSDSVSSTKRLIIARLFELPHPKLSQVSQVAVQVKPYDEHIKIFRKSEREGEVACGRNYTV